MSNTRPILLNEDHLEFSIAPKWLMRRTEINSNDKLVYIRLRNSTYKMGEYWVSQDYLSHECGFSIDTVKRSIKALVKAGLISKTQHGKKMFNSYQIHIHEWMTDENKYNSNPWQKEVEINQASESDSANSHFTQSDSANSHLVTVQDRTSIYKEQNKKQIYIVDNELGLSGNDSSLESLGEYRWKDWMKLYPNRDSKGHCVPKLQKMSKNEYNLLIEGTKFYLIYIELIRKNGFPSRNPQNASTFLNQKTYENAKEVLEAEKSKYVQKKLINDDSIFYNY